MKELNFSYDRKIENEKINIWAWIGVEDKILRYL